MMSLPASECVPVGNIGNAAATLSIKACGGAAPWADGGVPWYDLEPIGMAGGGDIKPSAEDRKKIFVKNHHHKQVKYFIVLRTKSTAYYITTAIRKSFILLKTTMLVKTVKTLSIGLFTKHPHSPWTIDPPYLFSHF